MAIPEWFFGPAGDLRPLPSPEMNVVDTIDRIGGVHTSINGSRTVDVLGHKSRYEFELRYLDPDEYTRLEAVYTGQISGDLYLTDPLKKNLLSREASSGRPATANLSGVFANSGSVNWVRLTDGPIPWTNRAASWTVTTADSEVYFDYTRRIPSITGEDFTFSVYVRCVSAVDVTPFNQPFLAGVTGTPVFGAGVSLEANTWTRVDMTVPGNTATADALSFGLQYNGGAESAVALQLVCPQVEIGTEPTSASMGGGCTRIAIDDMSTTSPYFPLRNVSLSLLEV